MIYLLEDDDSIRKLVVYALQSQGFQAAGFPRPSEFWAAMRNASPELVLLDIMLPEEDGISILRKRRPARDRRSARDHADRQNTEYDRAFGLDAGADDYISKPFGMMELTARVRAVLRRGRQARRRSPYRHGLPYPRTGTRSGGRQPGH